MSEELLPRDIAEGISNCGEALEKIVSELNAKQQAKTAPALLHHYTDGAGLLGILQSGRIRMTSIFHLNDPSELRHGIEMACAALERQAVGRHPAVQKFSQQFAEVMRNQLDQLACVFITSFSEHGDDLGQWRSYGADGRGFALGFNGPGLEKYFSEQGETGTTISIEYSDAEALSVMERMVATVLPVISLPVGQKLEDGAIRDFLTRLSSTFSLALLRVALLFKHSGYVNEREYRFLKYSSLHKPPKDLQYRARGATIVPFAEFHWRANGPQLFRKIIVGPASSLAAAKQFAESCLELTGLADQRIEIVHSTIPYRS